MKNSLTKEQIEDLVVECGSTFTFWRQNDALICCPIHGERNPSMGISADKQVCHCFSCGFKGSLDWLLFKSNPDKFKSYGQAVEYFDERYELERHKVSSKLINIPRYESTFDTIVAKGKSDLEELPLYMIAPFKSGKETYEYFFNRGFNLDDMKEFMIGRDLNSKTVTIPIFNKDDKLVGIIGRYISKKRKHNERYKIYSFERGKITYPLNKFVPIDDTMILVEGCFDAIRMIKVDYTNTQALMSNTMTEEQADLISSLVSCVIYIGDNDRRGIEARDNNIKMLKDRGVKVLIVDYPEYGKDPCEWSDETIHNMVENAHTVRRNIRRIN